LRIIHEVPSGDSFFGKNARFFLFLLEEPPSEARRQDSNEGLTKEDII
jgi:hypothetical protein